MAEGRGWDLDKDNRVGIVVVGLIGNWVAEIIQKSISLHYHQECTNFGTWGGWEGG